LAATVATTAAFAAIAASSSPAAAPVGSTGATGPRGVTGGTGASAPVITTGPVAAIGSFIITRAQFDHWMLVENDADQATTGQVAPAVPVPPDFTACIASLRGQPAQTGASDSALEQLCSSRYGALSANVMTFLIQAIWVEGEANAREVSVTQAQINASYVLQRRATKPPLTTAAELSTFLAESGQTLTDLKWRTRLNLLSDAIERRVIRAAKRVSAAQVGAYYTAHRSRFTGQSRQSASAEIRKVIASSQTLTALEKLHSRFSTLWRGRTVCLKGLAMEVSCGHGAASVAAKTGASYPGTILAPPSAAQTLVWPTPSG
jgi:hypothetical protein